MKANHTSRSALAGVVGGVVVATAWMAGPLRVQGAGGDVPTTAACTSTITGAHSGNIDLSASGTTTCPRNASQNGAITVASGAALSVVDSTVTGAITSTSSAPFTFCHSNTVRGAITVNSNTGGVEVGGNTTSGAITVTGNTAPTGGAPTEDAATELEGNHDGGKLTCTGNTPAPVNDGTANTVSGARVGQSCASGTF